jgi:hypothetical protein
MTQYSKFIAIVVATVLSGISAALLGDNTISPAEWVNIAVLAVGALAVFAAPNVPGAAYTKTILAVLAAGLTVLTSVITGGIAPVEWIQIALAGLGALGVYAIPNKIDNRNVLEVH